VTNVGIDPKVSTYWQRIVRLNEVFAWIINTQLGRRNREPEQAP
jgi:hypothetical protein